MVKELNVDCVANYAEGLKSAFTGGDKAITLGFEWEIPYVDRATTSNNLGSTELGVQSLHRKGMVGHFDSGGWEVATPVFDNLNRARYFARWLDEAAREIPFLEPTSTTIGNCGIHVHVSDKTIRPYVREGDYDDDRYYDDAYQMSVNSNYKKYRTVHAVMDMIMNRDSSYDLIYKFSKRQSGSGYRQNATATRWDTQANYLPNLSMFRVNLCPGADNISPTVELRLWRGISDRLLPALDFSHAMYKYARNFVKSNGVDETAALVLPIRQGNSITRTQELREFVPSMGDFVDWLDTQKGYKNLKNDEFFDRSLITA